MPETSKLSNEQLLTLLKHRLGASTPVNRAFSNDSLYREFLENCNYHMRRNLKNVTPISILHSPWVVNGLLNLAKLCGSVDVDNKVKKLPIVQRISDSINTFAINIVPVNEGRSPEKLDKPAKIAVMLVRSQAMSYIKEAFNMGVFDEASTELNDAADIIKLAKAIYNEDFKLAKELSYLDTCVREDIPATVWDWMGKNL